MSLGLCFILVIAFSALEGWLLHAHVTERHRRREVVRRSAVDQEMRAMRAAQQLSLLAWKTRHRMHDIARDKRGCQSKHATRRK
jgi:hypothetical protein